jgi:hypothetical protein
MPRETEENYAKTEESYRVAVDSKPEPSEERARVVSINRNVQ